MLDCTQSSLEKNQKQSPAPLKSLANPKRLDTVYYKVLFNCGEFSQIIRRLSDCVFSVSSVQCDVRAAGAFVARASHPLGRFWCAAP